ncbi:hypothetical protein DITRI_Ditri16bG0090600 [Diplodiscus trichospermus]
MAVILLLLVLSVYVISTAVAQPRYSNVSLGSSLTPRGPQSVWLSPSGLYAFGFYKQANGYAVGIFLAGVPQKTVVWTANRDDPPVPSSASLLLTNDGSLILRTTIEISVTDDSTGKAAAAAMFDSGNFVLYNSEHEIIWESFKHPTTTILQGQQLSPGAQLFSSVSDTDQSTGLFLLAMQGDGNLVQYPAVPRPISYPEGVWYAYWASNTAGTGDNVSLNLDNDGRLYLLSSTGLNIKNISGGYDIKETLYLMKIDPDGIFRIYSYKLNQDGNRSVIYESSSDRCDPKGLCGLNAYCVTAVQRANCKCLPGFTSFQEGNSSAGCGRDLTMESCSNDSKRNEYTIQVVANTEWEDDGYSGLTSLTKEDCAAACLEDCLCEAATFKDGKCTKQKLPLRFGRWKASFQGVALIKIGLSGPIESTKQEHKRQPQMVILIIGLSLSGLAVLLVIFVALILRSHVFTYKKVSTKSSINLCENVAPISFSFAEIDQLTDNFKEEIGKGAFGTVYKGTIADSLMAVAVKRLDNLSSQGEQEFKNEMKIIGSTHHRNLVRLIGYCHEGANRLLVYEYMVNGSLADVLFTPEKRPCWNQRVEIARNIARGLLYLHEECQNQIIHCDIKSQNILMDQQGKAKISDFGLAKLLKPDQNKTFTGIRGTRGYVAPEWHRKLPVTVKADVYSFGVVLLEIICCRLNINWSLVEEEAVIEEWVYNCFQAGELRKLIGKDEEVDEKQLERMVRVGLWCILDDPTLRPSMKKVLLMLEGTVEIPVPPSPNSFFTAI